jgi:flavodoxin/ferredoxin
MQRCLIVYYSQEGTTAKVAQRIADGLRAKELEVDLANLKDNPAPTIQSYDMIGLGFPVYFSNMPYNVAGYVGKLHDLKGLPYFTFTLHGNYRGDASTRLRRMLKLKGGKDLGYFHCAGENHFVGYVRRGYLFSPDHPTAEELARAESFGSEVAERLSGKPFTLEAYDHPAPLIYRIERMVLNRWFTALVYSRLFQVKAKRCNDCDTCIKVCPTQNIKRNRSGKISHGSNCIMCLSCESRCPQEAITSPLSWKINSPLIFYNVWAARRDPSIEHARAIHSAGNTQRI